MKKFIQNFDELATNKNRELVLSVVEAGLNAINTENIVLNSLKLEGDILNIEGQSFDLSKFNKIKVVGFGKASCDGALALEKVLGSRIVEGAVIGLNKVTSQYIETFSGTHPRPSGINIGAGQKIYEIIKDSNENDLIIALVSGGGSALLCYDQKECEQGAMLYDSFLKSGQTITEINTIRKHLSVLKGGGLAKIAYPATVVGLVFSDIPGSRFDDVASGPTYKDKTTTLDAQKIIDKYNLGNFNLIETPKEDKYFEKVHNFVLVSNQTAVEAMAKRGESLGLKTKIISTELYDEINVAVDKIFFAREKDTLVLAGGEPSVVVKDGGKGGRNLHMALTAIKNKMVDENSVFVSLASDGLDNSDVAGALVDKDILENIGKLDLNVDEYLESFNSYNFFQKAGGMIVTGPTGSNVSDLMILLSKE
ncbi:MAG: DUF4147 domain-containing protein [Candidatus Paceibacterota bacterium]|jgi:glycerate-2-kinase